MKRATTASVIIIGTAIFLASCGRGAKDNKGNVGDLKVKLEGLKKEKRC